MTRRTTLQAIASLLILGTLLVLPPVFLSVTVGNPLPRGIPSGEQISNAIRFLNIDPWSVVKVLAIFVWINWAYVVAVTALEFVAQLRGHAARLRLPCVQQALARLVGMITFAITTLTHSNAPALAFAGPTTEQPELPVEPGATDLGPRPVPDANRPVFNGPTTEVGWLESYAEIAERTLGDAGRWSEIRDLNVGQVMPNGHEISAEDEELQDGWTVRLPPDANTSTQPPRPPTEVIVQPGDSIWAIAERHLGFALGRPPEAGEVVECVDQMIEHNRDRFEDPGNPDLILPGQAFVLPPIASTPPPEPTAPPPSQTGVAADHEEPSSVQPQSPASPDRSGAQEGHRTHQSSRSFPAGVIGAVSLALAAGVCRAVQLRRHRRAFRSHQLPPSPRFPRVHRELLDQASESTYERLRQTLDQLAVGLHAKRHGCRPLVVEVRDERIEVLLDRAACEAVDGWKAEASGHIWVKHTNDIGDRPAAADVDDSPAPAPLLVTLGEPAESGQMYLDLEAAGIVSLDGDVEVAEGVARSWIAELAHSPLASPARITVVGDLGARVADLDRVTRVNSWDESCRPDLWAEQTHQSLKAHRWPNGFVARGSHEWIDSLSSMVVITTEIPDQEVMTRFLEHQPASAALVIVGGDSVEGALHVDCSGDELRLPRLGLSCQPRTVSPVAVEAITELLADAAGEHDEVVVTDPDDQVEGAIPAPAPLHAVPNEPAYEVLVRVLGDITVEGCSQRLTPKQTALTSYIALHPGATAERIQDALWGASGIPNPKTFSNTLHETRCALGAGLLPSARGGRYQPGPGLLTDTALFEHRVNSADVLDGGSAIASLRQALDLVTGKVFTYPGGAIGRSYGWVSEEDLVTYWELKVSTAADRLASLLLDADQPDESAEVAHRMLQCMPTQTELTETLMRAYAVSGNRRAVHTAYSAHLEALRGIGIDDPAPSTSALFEQLRCYDSKR